MSRFNKLMKVLVTYLLCVSMLLGLGVPAYAATDTTAPVVKDIYITNPKDAYTEGDEIYFNVLLEEDSDIDYATLQFEIEGGSTLRSATFVSYDTATKIASFKILIDNSISSGTWDFFCFSVSDSFGNFESCYRSDLKNEAFLESLSFEVVGNATDITAPVVKDVYITNSKGSYTKGDIIYFNVVLEEDSDLDYALMHFRVDGSSAEIYTSFISYDADTKIATCKLLIDDSVSSGTWKLFDISVRDYYNNYKSYHSHELDTEMVEALSLEVVGNGTEITAPVIKDVYIANPKDSYTEGDQVYINVLLEEESDLDFAKLTFASGNGGKLISEYCTSYNPTTKIASFRFLIDESVIDGTWKFFSINVCDYYGNYVLYYSFDSEAAFLQDFSFKVDNTKEKDSPSSPDDFFTYDWIGCADSKPTVSLTSSTNQLYTMVVLPGSAASDVTITHTGSSSIIIGSWGRFTEGYELKFPVPGVYKLKFVQNVTNDTLYYYANITDHAVETIIEGKAPTCSETGLTEGKKCGSCGKIFVTQEIIPVTAHNWDQGIVTTQPTETSEGVLTYRCTNCSEIKTEVIDKLEHVHNYVAVITNPTCTEDGYTTHTCSGCGDYYVDSYVSATGHSFSYTENEGLKIGACQNCNAKVEQFGAPSWRLENNKLVGAEYTTGQVMIALYGENGRLIKAKFCWKGEAKTIDGLTLYRYKAPTFTKSDLAQAKQVLCFNFTEQYSPIRDVIEVFR